MKFYFVFLELRNLTIHFHFVLCLLQFIWRHQLFGHSLLIWGWFSDRCFFKIIDWRSFFFLFSSCFLNYKFSPFAFFFFLSVPLKLLWSSLNLIIFRNFIIPSILFLIFISLIVLISLNYLAIFNLLVIMRLIHLFFLKIHYFIHKRVTWCLFSFFVEKSATSSIFTKSF